MGDEDGMGQESQKVERTRQLKNILFANGSRVEQTMKGLIELSEIWRWIGKRRVSWVIVFDLSHDDGDDG